MDTHRESAACEDTITTEALSTAETLASAGSTNYVSTTVHGLEPLKSVVAVASVPKVDSWLQHISQPGKHATPGIILDSSVILPPDQPGSPTTSSREPPFLRQPPTGPRSTYATVLAGKNRSTVANVPARFSGPGPQPLRGIPGFPGQQAPQARAAPLGSGRLPNGKIGARL